MRKVTESAENDSGFFHFFAISVQAQMFIMKSRCCFKKECRFEACSPSFLRSRISVFAGDSLLCNGALICLLHALHCKFSLGKISAFQRDWLNVACQGLGSLRDPQNKDGHAGAAALQSELSNLNSLAKLPGRCRSGQPCLWLCFIGIQKLHALHVGWISRSLAAATHLHAFFEDDVPCCYSLQSTLPMACKNGARMRILMVIVLAALTMLDSFVWRRVVAPDAGLKTPS